MKVSVLALTPRILASELEKIATLPPVRITVICTFLYNLGMAAAFASASGRIKGAGGTLSILQAGLASMGYVQAGFILMGILAVCSEYTGGQIRTSLTAVPWRGLQLSMKHLALAVIAVPAAGIMAASGVLYAFMRMNDAGAAVEPEMVWRSLAGVTGCLALTALLSAAIAAICRRTAPAMVVLFGYFYVIGPLTRGSQLKLRRYFPDTAGFAMYTPITADNNEMLTAVQGTGIFLLWVFTLLAAAIILYRRRDA